VEKLDEKDSLTTMSDLDKSYISNPLPLLSAEKKKYRRIYCFVWSEPVLHHHSMSWLPSVEERKEKESLPAMSNRDRSYFSILCSYGTLLATMSNLITYNTVSMTVLPITLVTMGACLSSISIILKETEMEMLKMGRRMTSPSGLSVYGAI